MRNFLPQEVLNKSKHGFGLPFGIWLKDYRPLRELAYDNMISLSERNIVRRRYVDGLIDAHQSVHAHYYGEMIWVLAMLEIWLTSHDVNV